MKIEQLNVLLHRDIIIEELVREGYYVVAEYQDTDISLFLAKHGDDRLRRNDAYSRWYIGTQWLDKGYDIRPFYKIPYTFKQLEELRKGVDKGLDVTKYYMLKYKDGQMAELRKGLERGLNVDLYANPNLSISQMKQIRLGLKSGVDVTKYNKSKFKAKYMELIRLGLEQGDDLTHISPQLIDLQLQHYICEYKDKRK